MGLWRARRSRRRPRAGVLRSSIDEDTLFKVATPQNQIVSIMVQESHLQGGPAAGALGRVEGAPARSPRVAERDHDERCLRGSPGAAGRGVAGLRCGDDGEVVGEVGRDAEGGELLPLVEGAGLGGRAKIPCYAVRDGRRPEREADAADFAPKGRSSQAKYITALKVVNEARAAGRMEDDDAQEAFALVGEKRTLTCADCRDRGCQKEKKQRRVADATIKAHKTAKFLNQPCGCGLYCGGVVFTERTIGACSYEHRDPATKPTRKNGKKVRPSPSPSPSSLPPIVRS